MSLGLEPNDMARRKRQWEFLERTRKMPFTTRISNNVLQNAGFSDEEILVREALQNSCDAHEPGSDSPVTVKITKQTLTGARKSALVAALALDAAPADRKAVAGFSEDNALKHIASPRKPLTVMTIEDHYTHGLGGAWDGVEENDHFGRLVVTLGNDDKSENERGLGGSFGFGKTVYGKASGIGIVVYYSVFKPSRQSGKAYARLMATGFFPPHQLRGRKSNGFAFYGAPENEGGEVGPFVDEEAHRIAVECGLVRRDPGDYGTSILILDCDRDISAMRVAAETFWWPRLIRNELVVSFDDGAGPQYPRPKQNETLAPFIECYRNLLDDTAAPPKTQLYQPNRFRERSLGRLSCTAINAANPLANHVALVRQPGMVVQYCKVGSDSLEPCAGLFHGHEDVEKILTYSEPPSHHEWDHNADRLKKKFQQEGIDTVKTIHDRIGKYFREFQRLQEPPIPEGGPLPKELSRLLGKFLSLPGGVHPTLEPADRPVSISVQEDRIQDGDTLQDTALITLAVDESDESAPNELECVLTIQHEILGDASHRMVSRSVSTVKNSRGKEVAIGSPASLQVTLKKGRPERFTVSAPTQADYYTRYRVTVEESDDTH